jgi:hypothetical protein
MPPKLVVPLPENCRDKRQPSKSQNTLVKDEMVATLGKGSSTVLDLPGR